MAWAEAAVAATETERCAPALGSIMAAAMVLPGVLGAPPAQAQGKPDAAVVGLRALGYKDSQPGLERINVVSPSFEVVAPLSERWWLQGALVSDSVSGASPRYHSAVSGASRMTEQRQAGEVKVTHYFNRASLGVGVAGSTETDYRSVAGSVEASLSTDDQNLTLHVALGGSSDRINPVNQVVVDEQRHTLQGSVGVTRVPSRSDVVQLTLSHSAGRGYFSDPYKVLDERPRVRRQSVLLLRWNHHFDDWGTTLRSSWRSYLDTYDVQAHALQLELVAPLSANLKIVPSMRAYTQTAASFYADPVYDPVLGEPFPAGYDRNNPPQYISLDQRLSSFGAVTLGLGLVLTLDRVWTLDGKFEAYEQRGRWAWDGNGSVGLAPFRARSAQLGLSRRF
jgi:hypothetical protein